MRARASLFGYQQKLIGDSGYLPPWAKPGGRWAAQKTYVSYRELFSEITDFYGGVVWIPKKSFGFVRSANENRNALSEFSSIPFFCGDCGWSGWAGDTLFVGLFPWGGTPGTKYARVALDSDPNKWHPECPECDSNKVLYDARRIEIEKIYRRWLMLGSPTVEYPICDQLDSRDLGVLPVGSRAASVPNLEALLQVSDRLEPQELVYVAQQMWPSLAEALRSMAVT